MAKLASNFSTRGNYYYYFFLFAFVETRYNENKRNILCGKKNNNIEIEMDVCKVASLVTREKNDI